MASANGNGVFFKWAAGGLAIALSGVIVWAADGAKDTLVGYRDTVTAYIQRVDTLEHRVSQGELAQAKITLQLASIAQALRVPVVVDTTKADAIVKKDST